MLQNIFYLGYFPSALTHDAIFLTAAITSVVSLMFARIQSKKRSVISEKLEI